MFYNNLSRITFLCHEAFRNIDQIFCCSSDNTTAYKSDGAVSGSPSWDAPRTCITVTEYMTLALGGPRSGGSPPFFFQIFLHVHVNPLCFILPFVVSSSSPHCRLHTQFYSPVRQVCKLPNQTQITTKISLATKFLTTKFLLQCLASINIKEETFSKPHSKFLTYLV